MMPTERPPSAHYEEKEERDEEDHRRGGEEDHTGPSLGVRLVLFLVLGDAHLFHHALYHLDVRLGEVLPLGGRGHCVLLDGDVDAVMHKTVLVAVLIHWPVVHLVGVTVHVFTIVTVLIVTAKVYQGSAHGTPQHVTAEAPYHCPSCSGACHMLHVGFRLTGLVPLTVGATTLTPASATMGLSPAATVGLSPAASVGLSPATSVGLSPATPSLGWIAVASRTTLPWVSAPPSVPSSARLWSLLAEPYVTPCGHKENEDPATYMAFHHDYLSATAGTEDARSSGAVSVWRRGVARRAGGEGRRRRRARALWRSGARDLPSWSEI